MRSCEHRRNKVKSIGCIGVLIVNAVNSTSLNYWCALHEIIAVKPHCPVIYNE